jgi:hypothetical protein
MFCNQLLDRFIKSLSAEDLQKLLPPFYLGLDFDARRAGLAARCRMIRPSGIAPAWIPTTL